MRQTVRNFQLTLRHYKSDKIKNTGPNQEQLEKSTRFVIHEHKARRAGLHYDLRIKVGDVLKDWAFRKSIPEQVGVKRLGIKQGDHDPIWLDFEGTIEDGYGAGEITIWDKGDLILKSVEDKKIVGIFNGRKISGSYVLVEASKLGGWLMWKQADSPKRVNG